MDARQLRQIPLFSDAADDELQRLGAFAESVEFSERAEIIREGDFSRALLAIESAGPRAWQPMCSARSRRTSMSSP